MGKAPAFQFYAGDRAMDLMGLDNEACGAWIRAVMYLWTTGPASEERVALASGKGWERVRFMFSDFDGGIGLQWMEDAREKQRVFRENASEYGAKGGRPPKRKKGTLSKTKGNPNPTQRVGSMKIEGEVEEEIESEAKRNARETRIDLTAPAPYTDIWLDFLAHRREIKKPMTLRSQRAALCKLAAMTNPTEALRNSISNGWQGIFEPDKTNGKQAPKGHQHLSYEERVRAAAEYATSHLREPDRG